MSTPQTIAQSGVESALSDAVQKISEVYELCLVDANSDPAKEADCRLLRDRGLAFANRAYEEMTDAVNKHWP